MVQNSKIEWCEIPAHPVCHDNKQFNEAVFPECGYCLQTVIDDLLAGESERRFFWMSCGIIRCEGCVPMGGVRLLNGVEYDAMPEVK